ncbi:AaceriAGL237Cp [[Ashbya] aceris (nom. inval.)]|nr:AaceriAGL237Cp [[Ashbya] aceris (nom. inval.)]
MALEPIDVTTHSSDIEAAYQKVVRGKDSDTTWLILSPGDKRAYSAAKTGSEFEEFLGSFDESKVEFGLARVSPPGSDVEKLLLVGWCPDSAPLKTRASFTSNFATISDRVLKAYHVQVTARDEDDLNERELLMKISNAAGARYSIQQDSRTPTPTKTTSAPRPRPGDVPKPRPGSTPVTPSTKSTPAAAPAKPATPSKPAAPTRKAEPAAKTSEDGWGDEPEVKERDLMKEPVQPTKSSWKPIGKVDLQSVISEEKAKADPRLVSVLPSEKTGQKLNPSDDIAKLKAESKQKREYEYEQVLKAKGSVTPSRSSPARETADEDAESSDSDHDQTLQVEDAKARFEKMQVSQGPTIIQPKPTSKPAPAVQEETAHKPGDSHKKFGMPLPGMHEEEKPIENDTEDDSWEEEEKPPAAAPLPPPRRVAAAAQPSRETPEPAEKVDDTANSSTPSRTASLPPPPPARRSVEAKKEPAAPTAIAEYDYEAGEDNELTFEEGDVIINIDFVDDDWWLGELQKTGQKGLFPSNYVELQQ